MPNQNDKEKMEKTTPEVQESFSGFDTDLPPLPQDQTDTVKQVKEPSEAGLLKRIEVNPLSLSRALVLASTYGVEFGRTGDEQREVEVFFRENDIFIVTDFDTMASTTVEGEPRPFRYRFSVPLLRETGEGAAKAVGVKVRLHDLLEALRNREKNSFNYGVLAEDVPVTLEVWMDKEKESRAADREKADRIVVHPTRDGSLAPRWLEVLAGASLEGREELDLEVADQGVSGLDPDALIEIGGISDPEVGVLLSPGEEGYVVGANARGIMLSTFKGEGQDDSGQRSLTEPTVLSERLAIAAGFTQLSFQNVARSRQRLQTDRVNGRIMAAAITAALDTEVEGDERRIEKMLKKEIGKSAVKKAMKAGARSDNAAVSTARSLGEAVPADERKLFAGVLKKEFDLGTEDVDIQDLSPVEAIIARAYEGNQGDLEKFFEVASYGFGEAALRAEARRVLAHLPEVSAHEQLRNSDLGVAAVSLTQKKAAKLADTLLPKVSRDASAEWWNHMLRYMRQLGVPKEARKAVATNKKGGLKQNIPPASELGVPASLREAWLEECQRGAQGRLWKDETGRVFMGIEDPEAGHIMISDSARQPDPHKYPISHSQVEKLLAKGRSFEWKGTLWSDDVEDIANQVVSMRRSVFKDSDEAHAIFLARWVPETDLTDPAGRRIEQQYFDAEQRRVIEPGHVEGSEKGSAVRHFVLARSEKEPVEKEEVAGRLRIYGLDSKGEKLLLNLPMKERPTVKAKHAEPVAFVLDARDLQHLVAFISRKGRQSVLSVSDGLVRIFDLRRERMSIAPTITATQVPEELRPLVELAGIGPQAGREVEIDEMISRLSELRQERLLEAHNEKERVKAHIRESGSQDEVVGSISWRRELEERKEATEAPGVVIDSQLTIDENLQRLKFHLKKVEAQVSEWEDVLYGHAEDLFGNKVPSWTKQGLNKKTIQNRLSELRADKESTLQEIAAVIKVSASPAIEGEMRRGLERYEDIIRKEVEKLEEDGELEVTEEKVTRTR